MKFIPSLDYVKHRRVLCFSLSLSFHLLCDFILASEICIREFHIQLQMFQNEKLLYSDFCLRKGEGDGERKRGSHGKSIAWALKRQLL